MYVLFSPVALIYAIEVFSTVNQKGELVAMTGSGEKTTKQWARHPSGSSQPRFNFYSIGTLRVTPQSACLSSLGIHIPESSRWGRTENEK